MHREKRYPKNSKFIQWILMNYKKNLYFFLPQENFSFEIYE